MLTQLTPGRKRQMILAPEINPSTFLYFFEKGQTGYSYSLRDYSEPHRVTERYAREFGVTADEIRRRASQVVDAPALDVRMLAQWHEYTVALNRHFGLGVAPLLAKDEISASPIGAKFPILWQDQLLAHPKAAKTADMRRIFHSPRSEDWVTWNSLMLLTNARMADWWPRLVACARRDNPAVNIPVSPQPRLQCWTSVASPASYLRHSGRAEGRSEIDVIFESEFWVLFAEAKLTSDISLSTTHDPARNQIIRNIDCALDYAGERPAYFWMLVKDRSPHHAFSQLMREYRCTPETLARELPHRDPQSLRTIAEQLAIVTWDEILGSLCVPNQHDEAVLTDVKAELLRRVR